METDRSTYVQTINKADRTESIQTDSHKGRKQSDKKYNRKTERDTLF